MTIFLYHLKVDNKVHYVGLTSRPKRRKTTHARNFPNHEFCIIDSFTDANLASLAEANHITLYNTYLDRNLWNKDPGGNYAESCGISRKGIGGCPKGTKQSAEARKKRSERLKGKPVHPNCKRPVGINHSEETKKKLSEAAKKRQSFFCNSCNKSISGKMNWDRHLLSQRHRSQL